MRLKIKFEVYFDLETERKYLQIAENLGYGFNLDLRYKRDRQALLYRLWKAHGEEGTPQLLEAHDEEQEGAA